MKGIQDNILQILSSVKDLLPLERKMREDRVVVHPGPVGGKKLSRVVRPWKPLPNVSKMQIKLAVHDWLLLLFGLYKRYLPDIEFGAGRNAKANAYIDYMFKRLRRQVKLHEYSKATETMWLLMNSPSYQVTCFNFVAKGWYKNMRFSEVMKTIREVKQLAKKKVSAIDFKRVYLETPNKIRPLGVPTLPGRVYLHMYNNLITEGRMITETGSQHAYLPGRGVITAWEHLLSRIDRAKNIYEADFKGFFDNISHQGLTNVCLEQLRLPVMEVKFINALNQNLVKLTGEDKLIERDRKGLTTRTNGLGTIPGRFILFSEIARYFPGEIIIQGWDKTQATVGTLVSEVPEVIRRGQGSNLAFTQRMVYVGVGKVHPIEALRGKEIFDNPGVKTIGVPQGAPTSCSLATLALRPIELYNDVIIYADDVIYFPPNPHVDPVKVLSSPEMGIEVNDNKSQWAKKDGKGLVDYVKFVGFKYYPAKYTDTWQEALGYPTLMFLFIDLLFIHFPLFSLMGAYIVLFKRYQRCKPRFVASTRNGANLEFTDRESFLSFLNTGRTLLLNTYFESKLSGESLESGIRNQMSRGAKLHSPVKLITESFIKKAERFHNLKLRAGKLTDSNNMNPGVPHISLTGGFMSRMQANSGDIKVDQDFRLRGITGSWLDKYGVKYTFIHGISKKSLNIFVASSFACDGLLNSISRKPKSKVRGVLSSSRELKGGIKKLRTTFYEGRF